MSTNGRSRRLEAILFADVAGYSRLMGEDEAGTHEAITEHLRRFDETSGEYGGRVLEVRGDGVYALFDSVLSAVQFAVAVQKIVEERNREVPEDRRIRFRIGINVGDVLADSGHFVGDSVNIASRIEGCADPGGVCVSGAVYELIKHKLGLGYEYMGPQRLKNIRDPVDVYRVRGEAGGVVMAASPRLAVPVERGAPERPSLVVLPLANMSGDPAEDWFSDGITEDIITNLSKFYNLFVIARGSAFTYKGRRLSPTQVGQELGVRYVAEGSVRKAGNRVRISVQLIDARSGLTLWADRYDRELVDVFSLQDEITEIVVSATAVQIEAAERGRFGQTPPSDLEAYGLLLRGQQRIFRYTRRDNLEARQLYEAARRADPRYARALAALSRTLNIDWRYSWANSPDEALDDALSLAQEAVALDEADARGHAELGFVYLYRKEHELALSAYERALALNPNDADIMSDMADALAHSGRSEKAIGLLGKAMMLNPFYPDQYLWHLGGAYFNLKRYDQAIDTIHRMNNPTEGRRLLAASYAHLGRAEEARREAAAVRKAHPDFSLERWAKVQPDKHADDVAHFVEGLEKAGL